MNVKIKKTDIISDNKYTYKRVDFDLEIEKNKWEAHSREVLDRGNGATILLYNKSRQSVILTNQFRIPTYLNGNASGMMIEACAGVIDDESPTQTMIRETEEETGFHITNAIKVMEAYMSPGAVTEILHFFVAEYEDEMKKSKGGGLASECEHIQVLEVTLKHALEMVKSGEIKDAKTIMLLQFAVINQLLG